MKVSLNNLFNLDILILNNILSFKKENLCNIDIEKLSDEYIYKDILTIRQLQILVLVFKIERYHRNEESLTGV